MCLFVLAQRASERFPLVIAANRDELYSRPTLPAAFWDDAPGVVGGRDALQGGSWLAIDDRGRFAAVTNLRGTLVEPGMRSRGELVRGFVTGAAPPLDYLRAIDRGAYAGFHLVVGDRHGAAILSDEPALLAPGIHALSNAPPGERWPKMDAAEEAMRARIGSETAETLVSSLLDFLHTPIAFVKSDVYGTRASTVIVVEDDAVLFVEEPNEGRPVRLSFPLLG